MCVSVLVNKKIELSYLCLFFLVGVINTSFSQEVAHNCGAILKESSIKHVEELRSAQDALVTSRHLNDIVKSVQIQIPVQFHILRESDGTGGISKEQVISAFDHMNSFFSHQEIHFFQYAPINEINNSDLYNHELSEKTELHSLHSTDSILNIYITDVLSFCGYASFPGDIDFIMMKSSCMNNTSTLIHEVGHYLGLYHTHTTFFGRELVTREGCDTTGDKFCDTPADPNLSGEITDGCIYESTETDANGDKYTPSVTNIMSYSTKGCRFEFSDQQIQFMRWTYFNERSYLKDSKSIEIKASFYIEEEATCLRSKKVRFINTSYGNIEGVEWDFGDGTISTDFSPTHIFNDNGIYNVSLTVSSSNISKTFIEKVVVGSVLLPYENNFDYTSSLNDFIIDNKYKVTYFLDDSSGVENSNGLVLCGIDSLSNISPFFDTPERDSSFKKLWNYQYKTSLGLCINATNYDDLFLEFDLKQLNKYNKNYTNFRIAINDKTVDSVYQVEENYLDDTAFTRYHLDLSEYDDSVFWLSFEGSHKYHKDHNGEKDGGTSSILDNIIIEGNYEGPSVFYSNFSATPHELLTVALNWKTDYEVFNKSYVIERSQDAKEWEYVNEIASFGHTNNKKEYLTIDLDPYFGTSYYRLTHINESNEKGYSEYKEVYLDLNDSDSRILAFPNPSSSMFYIISEDKIFSNVSLYDVNGKDVTANVEISYQNSGLTLNVIKLLPGMYFLNTRIGLVKLVVN